MEDLGAHAQRIGEGLRAHRLHHEFLDIDVVVGVFATVDDVHHRHGHAVLAGSAVQIGDMSVERHALRLGSSFCRGQRYSQNGVRAQAGLVLGAIELDHGTVQALLIDSILTHQQIPDRSVDVGYGFEYALTHIAALVTITQFQCFARARGCARGGAGATDDAAVQNDVCFYGRVAA